MATGALRVGCPAPPNPGGRSIFMGGILPSEPRIAHLTFRSPSVSLHGAVRGTRQGRRSRPQGLALTRWPGLYALWAGEREGGWGEGIALDIDPVTPHPTVRFPLAQWWEALGQPLQTWRCRVLSPQL